MVVNRVLRVDKKKSCPVSQPTRHNPHSIPVNTLFENMSTISSQLLLNVDRVFAGPPSVTPFFSAHTEKIQNFMYFHRFSEKTKVHAEISIPSEKDDGAARFHNVPENLPVPEFMPTSVASNVTLKPITQTVKDSVDYYIPSDHYTGEKVGYVFKMADRGLGYYREDKTIDSGVVNPSEDEKDVPSRIRSGLWMLQECAPCFCGYVHRFTTETEDTDILCMYPWMCWFVPCVFFPLFMESKNKNNVYHGAGRGDSTRWVGESASTFRMLGGVNPPEGSPMVRVCGVEECEAFLRKSFVR